MSIENEEEELRDKAYQEAAAWFVRLHSGEHSDNLATEFNCWLAQNPRHKRCYARAKAAWNALESHADTPEVVNIRRSALIRAHWNAKENHTTGKNRGAPLAQTAGPDSKRRYAGFWVPAAVAVAVSLLMLVVFRWERPSQQDMRFIETGIGERRLVTLEDNSRIELDAQSRVAIAYTQDVRSVALHRGQVHFDVAHDPLRPFKVRAANQTVVALGTAFNVELLAGEVLVTLIEGRVAIAKAEPSQSPTNVTPVEEYVSSAKHTQLMPGQQLSISAEGETRLREKIDLGKTSAWRRGKLIFEGDSLSEAIIKLNRHSRIRIEIQDGNMADFGVSGVFDAGDSAAFVEALEAYFPIKAVYLDKHTIGLVSKN